jgi:hypothetical protein
MQNLGMKESEVDEAVTRAARSEYGKLKRKPRGVKTRDPRDMAADEIRVWNLELEQQIADIQGQIEEEDRAIASLNRKIGQLKKPTARTHH